MPSIEVVVPPLVEIGEALCWDVRTDRLWWIDVFGQAVFHATADGRDLRVTPYPELLTALALGPEQTVVVAAGAGVHRFDPGSGAIETLVDATADGVTAFNDGKTDRQGRFVTGQVDLALAAPDAPDPATAPAPAGRIYSVDRDRHVERFDCSVGVSNGTCFSPDGTTLYWGDSWARVIRAYDYDPATGTPSGERTLVRFTDDTPPGGDAVPDGSTVDAEGGLWVAACYGGEVRRYAPDGTLDRRIALPVHNPTCVGFGGADLDVLFVTSLRVAPPGATHRVGPLDGAILAVHGLGVRGVPEVPFGG